ncbi:MAG: phosphoribosylamine--glycine ligase [Candidatus Eremiobacteraeota bacterium]|nr:phosphoribosylamine--glycine ligase [Candidatus Eremiobacteraeota bacterium]
MRILVVGNGAREDALSWRLAQSPSCSAIFAAPGNAGTASRGENWAVPATNGKKLAHMCVDNNIDLVVLGPETAIAAGVGDQLRERGIPVFGPGRSGGRLESSKIFSKRFMERHSVPTANAVVVHTLDTALKALEAWKGGCVVKADGLAAGKGVVVTDDPQTARAVVTGWYKNNRVPGGGTGILLEEKLEGREVSVFAISDGRAMLPIAAACDYKRAGDGDTGPNTGGMGAYSPPSGFPDDMFDQVRGKILSPVLRGLLAEGETYIGVLYCGLMWTKSGPSVIEFNVRFGDPETQVMMPRMTGDFAELLKSAADGALDASIAGVSEQACVGVVLATGDYPKTSTPLSGLPVDITLKGGAQAFWGGSAIKDDKVDVNGGRVMTVTATGDTVQTARIAAYEAVDEISKRLDSAGASLTYRRDIAGIVESTS